MSEHSLLGVITILVTIGVCLLGIMVTSIYRFKRDVKETLKEICKANEKEHGEIWDRVNHHFHNGGGNVVIPTPGSVPRGG